MAERNTRLKAIAKQIGGLTKRLSKLHSEEVGDFLNLAILTEVLDTKVGQVGRYERGVFAEAFQVLLAEKFEVSNMEPCWRAS